MRDFSDILNLYEKILSLKEFILENTIASEEELMWLHNKYTYVLGYSLYRLDTLKKKYRSIYYGDVRLKEFFDNCDDGSCLIFYDKILVDNNRELSFQEGESLPLNTLQNAHNYYLYNYCEVFNHLRSIVPLEIVKMIAKLVWQEYSKLKEVKIPTWIGNCCNKREVWNTTMSLVVKDGRYVLLGNETLPFQKYCHNDSLQPFLHELFVEVPETDFKYRVNGHPEYNRLLRQSVTNLLKQGRFLRAAEIAIFKLMWTKSGNLNIFNIATYGIVYVAVLEILFIG